jgi:hypothetical protein
MTHRLLLAGHKPTFELFSFDTGSSTLAKVSSPPAPTSATWLERSPTVPDILYTSSENRHKAYCLSISGGDIRVIDERETKCTWPVHCESASAQRQAVQKVRLKDTVAIKSNGTALVTGGVGVFHYLGLTRDEVRNGQ